MKRIDLAIAKRSINRLDAEYNIWWSLWEEGDASGNPDARLFLNNAKSCGYRINKLMQDHNLEPGFKTTWLDKLICLIW